MLAEDFFATDWPAELPRLRRLVRRNGVGPDDVDDVLQESAARLYAAWGRVFEDRPIRPLLTTIVLNAARDHHRRTNPLVHPVATLPESALVEATPVDRVAIARLEVSRTARALATLPERQRRTVADAVAQELHGEQAGRRRAAAADRMAITRARRRLASALELIAGLAAIGAAWCRRAVSSPAAPATAAAAIGVVVLSAATLLRSTGPAAPTGTASVAAAHRSTVTVAGHDATPRSRAQVIVLGPAASFGSRGVSSWTLRPGPWLGLDVFGTSTEFGGAPSGHICTVRVAGLVRLTYACTPLA